MSDENYVFQALKDANDAGIIDLLSAVIAFMALIVVSRTLYNNKLSATNNQKAEIFFRLRDYYIDYQNDVINNTDLDVFEISDRILSVDQVKKKELAILYKIPLIIHREIEYCRKFGHLSDIESWKPWVVDWFKRDNFRFMWSLVEKKFSYDPKFLDFMDECLKIAIFEENKVKNIE